MQIDLQDDHADVDEGRERDGMLNYYYKRWLWMQFPWWCINQR